MDFDDRDSDTEGGTDKPVSIAFLLPGQPSAERPFEVEPSQWVFRLEIMLLCETRTGSF